MNVRSSADTTLCIDDFKYRFTDQPNGWFGATVKVDWPILTNLRLDPYERLGMLNPQLRSRLKSDCCTLGR